MKNILRTVLNILHAVSFSIWIFMGGLGVVYELLGHAKFEKILSVIGITNGFNKIWAVSIVSFLVWCVLYYIKFKVLGS